MKILLSLIALFGVIAIAECRSKSKRKRHRTDQRCSCAEEPSERGWRS